MDVTAEVRPHRIGRWLLVLVVAVATAVLPAAAVQGAEGGPKITVLTRNLYLGTGLTNVVTATTFPELIAAVTQNWANVVATNFPTRAKALAEEIGQAKPDVIGLQEVSLWRDQLVSDAVAGTATPNATNVVYDFLAILQAELASRGTPYTAVSTSTNADAEAPRANPDSPIGFTDVRLTDRDVILARTPLASKFANPADGHYAAQLTLPSVGGPVTFTRGWASIDYRQSAQTTMRLFNTHLEVASPVVAGLVQIAQGDEALEIIDASPYPVVALGDFNSAADGSSTPTYKNLTESLADAWSSAQPGEDGSTCCQSELLNNVQSTADERIDLVLTKGQWQADRVDLTGDEPFRLAPPPLWASDHFGVAARLELAAR